MSDKINETVSLFATENTWVEGEAIRQLEALTALEGVEKVFGFPDLHPGTGFPVGVAVITQNRIYPHLIGSDVGCGIALFGTGIKKRKFKPGKAVKRLKDLENPYEKDLAPILAPFGMIPDPFDRALGTIGGGNHFAEIQEVEKVIDKDCFKALSLDQNLVFVAIHSGSRGKGDELFESYAVPNRKEGILFSSKEKEAFLKEHEEARLYARINRELIARRMCEQLGTQCTTILDIEHNGLTILDPEKKKQLSTGKGRPDPIKGRF